MSSSSPLVGRGPFWYPAEAWHGAQGRLLSRFTLLDEGDGDAVVAAGAATFGLVEQTERTLAKDAGAVSVRGSEATS